MLNVADYSCLSLFFVLVLSTTATQCASGAGKDDAVQFVNSTTGQIPKAFRCFSYEALLSWSQQGTRSQDWEKVRSRDRCFCVHSGSTNNPKFQVPDPTLWQSDESVVIPERDFYTVRLSNERYTASFTDQSRFTEGAGKMLERVSRTSRPERPSVLMMMLGEVFTHTTVADFISNPSSEVVEFVDRTRDGRSAKKLVVRLGVESMNSRESLPNQFTWEFDTQTGYCVNASASRVGQDSAEMEYSIAYTTKSDDVWFPEKIIMRTGTLGVERTLYVRNCSTECTMNDRECLLSYHGLKEPDFLSDSSSRVWLIWANVGVVLIILGFLLRRYRRR